MDDVLFLLSMLYFVSTSNLSYAFKYVNINSFKSITGMNVPHCVGKPHVYSLKMKYYYISVKKNNSIPMCIPTCEDILYTTYMAANRNIYVCVYFMDQVP